MLLKVRELHYKFDTNPFFSSLFSGWRGRRQEVMKEGSVLSLSMDTQDQKIKLVSRGSKEIEPLHLPPSIKMV